MKLITFALAAALAAPAFATGNNDGECDHPVFVEKECVGEYIKPGPRGPQGPAGEQGPAGPQGLAGADGKDAGVPRNWDSEIKDYVSAYNAIEAHLARDKNNRVTWGVAGGNGQVGVGMGYARRIGDNADATLGVGRAGDETVFKFTLSGEF